MDEGRCRPSLREPREVPATPNFDLNFTVSRLASLDDMHVKLLYPDRKDKVLNRIRDVRGGKLNDANFGSRMRGQGVWAGQFKAVFEVARRKAGLDRPFPELMAEHFRPPGRMQMTLW